MVFRTFDKVSYGLIMDGIRVPAGGEKIATADLPAGSYEMYCPIEDVKGVHRRHGMRNTLVVGAGR